MIFEGGWGGGPGWPPRGLPGHRVIALGVGSSPWASGHCPGRGVKSLKCHFLALESTNRDDNPAPELSSICCVRF